VLAVSHGNQITRRVVVATAIKAVVQLEMLAEIASSTGLVNLNFFICFFIS
jgi:hypothetical protein